MSLRRRTVEVLVAAGLLGAALAPPATAAGHGPGPSVPLRVATYNIHAGAGMDNVFDLDRQAAALRALDADVIGLQEVDVRWGDRSEWRDLAAELGRRLRMHVSFAPIYSLDPVEEGGPRREFGVAVLSRYRIVSAENHDLTRLSTQDPNPVPAPAPGFGEVVLKVRGLPVHVYATHLDYRADPSVRVAQVADTRRIMAQDQRAERRPVRQILLGDFNAPPTAPELAPLWKELTDIEPGGPTYPAQDPVQRIDYVAVSKDTVRVRSAAVAETLASDHRPVVADLSLRR
ncbi:endonuclease/exonuclease/phosphatase family metal-dependent hydrolase [Streptomyces sp. KhCrAH-43]|uniref:endonuclease/exonuclease/phosphatase family protein n=1 Tax=Streptomyces TaxID=1883 RepID=UPI00039BFCFA|nr:MULTISPECIES: endonuclease/exonuclease/phosphatase family protein [unclassified Streptomyces]MYS33811.1 metal-dependent hydrolase [Streptomyces sp. SID4920]MYX70410.1 metal-dependent hydrolase [Streptomyces sp. SID8373]RAJ60781.1 endonuclease/exonuclease/phosphatase family metal-dependent hydrolase [Streptomyces sp. KhCrAH-43]